MTTNAVNLQALAGPAEAEALCELLLQLAGRSTGRMYTAKRHAEVLEQAFPFMTSPQKAVARARLNAIETKWGPMLWQDKGQVKNDGIPPEIRVGKWLSTRKTPVRYLAVLLRAATKVWEGETSMSNIMEYAFARELDYVMVPVGQTSFTEWMIELRIARKVSKGCYVPDALCGWWVSDMDRKSPAYRACLTAAWEMSSARGYGWNFEH